MAESTTTNGTTEPEGVTVSHHMTETTAWEETTVTTSTDDMDNGTRQTTTSVPLLEIKEQLADGPYSFLGVQFSGNYLILIKSYFKCGSKKW
jgi:hypothetical protein